MSSKNAKKARKILSGIKFPVLNIATANVTLEVKGDHRRVRKDDVQADHARRITRLAKSKGISIQAATAQHTKRIGMVPKPTMSDLDKRIEDLKRSSAERDPATGL